MRARAEIRKNKRALEAQTGVPVEHFAYPYGLRRYFDDRLTAYCQSIGLRTVARAIPATQHVPQGPVELHRHAWRFERPFEENLRDVSVEGRYFESLTGRSAVA
jgi:peptidoglycan/xylan/chitin deacetylase (PgdA/CDA1 family)